MALADADGKIEGEDPEKALTGETSSEKFLSRFADQLALMTDVTKSLYAAD